MSGSAYSIPIELDALLHLRLGPHTCTDEPPSYIDLNLPQVTHTIHDDFFHWINHKLPQPTASSKATLQYLKGIPFDVKVVSTRESPLDHPTYRVHFHFSGCAGMAEVSACLAAHWAHLWYSSEQTRIAAEILTQHRLIPLPTNNADECEYLRFAPAGDWGYAMYDPEHADHAGDDHDKDDVSNQLLALDVAYTEGEEAATRRALRQLEEAFLPQLQSGHCLCQLCAPNIDFHPNP
jgi:hypothetical protein